jgi:hypothetical protein
MIVDQTLGASGVTFEAWVYPTVSDSNRRQVFSTDDGGYDWSLLHQNGTWWVFDGSNALDTGLAVELNRWQHVAVVFDPSWVVGTQQGRVWFSKDMTGWQSPGGVSLGFDASTSSLAIGRNPGP